jgi:hypothetical protein
VRGTNRVHETGAGLEQGMIRQVDGSGAGQPGNDAAAAVRDREPGNRRAIVAAVGERAPGNWGDDVGRLGSEPWATTGSEPATSAQLHRATGVVELANGTARQSVSSDGR